MPSRGDRNTVIGTWSRGQSSTKRTLAPEATLRSPYDFFHAVTSDSLMMPLSSPMLDVSNGIPA